VITLHPRESVVGDLRFAQEIQQERESENKPKRDIPD